MTRNIRVPPPQLRGSPPSLPHGVDLWGRTEARNARLGEHLMVHLSSNLIEYWSGKNQVGEGYKALLIPPRIDEIRQDDGEPPPVSSSQLSINRPAASFFPPVPCYPSPKWITNGRKKRALRQTTRRTCPNHTPLLTKYARFYQVYPSPTS